MKKIFIILIAVLILSGCTQKDPLEGRSEQEVAACQLIQKFVVFYSGETEQTSWVDCNFGDITLHPENYSNWIVISPKPSAEHPSYDTYIRNVKYRQENQIEEQDTSLLIDSENQMIMDPNKKNPEAGRFFTIDENDLFERPTKEELVEIYGENILEVE